MVMEVVTSGKTVEKEQNRIGVESTKIKRRRIYYAIKRSFDVCFALIGMILLAIPMMVIALIIKKDSDGSPIFRQQRLGKNEKIFTIFKFRTMYTNTPNDVATNSLNTEEYTTKVGGFIREHSLDELPQLLNVLKGDMSFVGYRPVCLTEQKLNCRRAELGVFAMKPGITGYAQINGRDNVTSEEKALMDKYYVENCSLLLDLRCLIKTIKVVLAKDGVK